MIKSSSLCSFAEQVRADGWGYIWGRDRLYVDRSAAKTLNPPGSKEVRLPVDRPSSCGLCRAQLEK